MFANGRQGILQSRNKERCSKPVHPKEVQTGPTSLGKRTEKASDHMQSRAEELDDGPDEEVQKEVLISSAKNDLLLMTRKGRVRVVMNV